MKFFENEAVKIDQAHADLIYGLVVAHKPKKILELGVGGGKSADVILSAMEYNQNGASLTLVDNWYDFGYKMPQEVADRYQNVATIVSSSEKDFVFSTKEKFDFIMSDADHYKTDQWFEHVYSKILNDNGVLIYHDINLFENAFVNLRDILYSCKKLQLNHFLFNKNSRNEERCHRGMLVIFKNTDINK
jgi:predicted O-methyltransferase YrrM